MDDLISRQAAIDMLNRGLSKIPYINNTDTEMIRRDERICCIQEIRELPSAQPEKVCIANITLSEEQIREAVEKAKNEADAVEIVRCKDCKYQDENWRMASVEWLPCMDMRTGSNWYCGSAERADE